MKKFLLTITILLATLCAVAQTRFWVYKNDGTQTDFIISEFDSITFTKPKMERCKASDYPQVTIGTQIWMAENYRCSKYDTESEAYNASWLTNNTVPVSNSYSNTPAYIDAADKDNWTATCQTKYGVNLTDAQVSKLGYSYNWAAAVGVADGREQATAFSGKCQGICPNGWHLPSKADWETLAEGAERRTGESGVYYTPVGNWLKSKTGWYNANGTNDYGFFGLPAGYGNGGHVDMVGLLGIFWTADAYGSECAWNFVLNYLDATLAEDNTANRSLPISVRCLKN